MCFLQCFKNFMKKCNETKIEDLGSAPQQKIEGENQRFPIDLKELIEPLPDGYENQVRVFPDRNNDFDDPRGQMTMAIRK